MTCFMYVFCCFLQTSGAIYESSYSSTTCSVTEGLTHRSPLLAGVPFVASPTESPITPPIAASTPTASPTTTFKYTSTYCSSCSTSDGCTSTWVYAPASGLPTSGATYYSYAYYSTSTCGGSPYYVSVSQSSSCTVSTSCKASSSGGGYIVSCINGGSITTGTITTGYMVTNAQYGSDSTCSTTPLSVTVQPLGCNLDDSNSYRTTADNNGQIYSTGYSSTTCTGTVTSSGTYDSPLPCTSYSTSSGNNYYKGYYYSATIPSVSTGTGTVQTTNYYNSESSCTGTPYSIMVQQTSACSTSTCTVRESHHTSSSSCSSGGVATTTVGTVTTGFAIAAASYASTDTTCSSPVAYTIYPLSSCIPTSSSSHDDTSRG